MGNILPVDEKKLKIATDKRYVTLLDGASSLSKH
jgi:hypothetical protein